MDQNDVGLDPTGKAAGNPFTAGREQDWLTRLERWNAMAEEECSARGLSWGWCNWHPYVQAHLGNADNDAARERRIIVAMADEMLGSGRDNVPSGRDNIDPSRRAAAVTTFTGEQGDDDGDDPRVRDNFDLSRRLDRGDTEPEDGDRKALARDRDNLTLSRPRKLGRLRRPRGDFSSPDLVFEQRAWAASIVASPFFSRKSALPAWRQRFGLSVRTFDRRLAEIREGWRPPFRRET